MADIKKEWEPIDQPERNKAINTINSNVVVSASAGSGKTHIMMDKVGTMAKGEIEGCDTLHDISSFLIVTFTKAAASELKYKVADTLLKAIQEINDKIEQETDTDLIKKMQEKVDHLKIQIEELPLASISTIHSACSQIIRQYFQQADVDPAFVVMEEDEASLLFNKSVQKVLKDANLKPNKDYINLTKFFGDDNLAAALSTAYGFVINNVDYKSHFDEDAMKTYVRGINNTENANLYLQYHLGRLADLVEKANQIKVVDFPVLSVEGQQALDKYVIELEDDLALLSKAKDLEDCARISSTIVYQKLSCPKFDSTFVDIKEKVKKVRDAFKTIQGKFNIDFETQREYMKQDELLVKSFTQLLAKIDEVYSEAKKDENKLDFNDLEQKMVVLLQDDDIKGALRAKYKYIFVDECQDVNPIQDYIIQTLSSGNNLFMVGDLKQSIYGFRKSDPSLFKQRIDDYQSSKLDGVAVGLNTNFRSKQGILDFVNDVFAPLMSERFGGVDYATTAMLSPSINNVESDDEEKEKRVRIALFNNNPIPEEGAEEEGEEEQKEQEAEEQEGATVEVDYNLNENNVYSVKGHTFDVGGLGNDKEAQYIIDKIDEMTHKIKGYELNEETNQMEPVYYKYSDMTILFEARTTPAVQNIIKKIREYGYPINTANATKAAKNYDIALLISLLNIIDNDKQDVPLTNVLLSVIGGFNAAELAKIRRSLPRKEGETDYFYQAFDAYDLRKDELSERIKAFKDMLEKYRFESKFMCVADLIEKIIDDTMFDEYVLAQENGESSMNQIKTFIKELRNKNYNSSISKFLSTYREYDSIDSTKEVFAVTDGCINTSTIHASKGLQYPIVFLINVNKGEGIDSRKMICQKDAGIVIKHFSEDTLNYEAEFPFKLTKWAETLQEREEKMRLLYVALTRAEDYLFVTGMSNGLVPYGMDVGKSPEDFETMAHWLEYSSSKMPNFIADYLDKTCINYQLREKTEEDIKRGEVKISDCATTNADLVKELESLSLENYPYYESTQSPLWYSVTQINKNGPEVDIEDIETLPTEIDLEEFFGDIDDTSPEVGTAYHKVLELLDFDKEYEEEDIEKAMKEMVQAGDLEASQELSVNPKVVKKFLDSDFMVEIRNRQKLKEQGFRMYTRIPKEILGKDLKDKILIQGTFDLFVPREGDKESILIDYKFSKKNQQDIAKTYTKQMRLYKLAIETCLKEPVDKMFIYVIGQNEKVEIK